MSGTGTAATTADVVRSDEEDRMRVLLAIHGGLMDDLLPGVEPFLDEDDIITAPWPRGWVID